MAELLFIATTIFVAYVIFVVVGGNKEQSDSGKPEMSPPPTPEPTPAAEPEKAPTPPAAVKTAAKPAPKKTKAAPAKTASAKAATTEAPATPTAAASADSLKNPKTGEVAKLPANYAFAKRWIKEALVEEGLLDKVYKNNELDSATTSKIHDALQQLKAMAKYQ